METEYLVCGAEQGDIKSFKTLKEAKEFIEKLLKLDEEYDIQDTYHIEIIEW